MICYRNRQIVSASDTEMEKSQSKSKINTGITSVILAGSRDFGRCELASKFPPALWPVFDKPVICRLLQDLAYQGLTRAVICCNGNKPYLQQALGNVDSMKVSFSEEHFPSGTAGCIRDSAEFSPDDIFLVLSAQTTLLPDIQNIICEHKARQSDLTVVFCHDSENDLGTTMKAQFYICNRPVINCIPPKGYFDIKESLIPALFRKGMQVTAHQLHLPALSFRNRQEYLSAIWGYLTGAKIRTLVSEHWDDGNADDVVIAPDAAVDSTARIFGPVVIMNKSVVSANAVIFGPAVIGREVYIGSNSLVEKSVLWDGSSIGKDCLITNCIVDYNVSIPPDSVELNKALVFKMNGE